jgi:hypothetical protein
MSDNQFEISPPTHEQRWAEVEISDQEVAAALRNCVAMFYDVSEAVDQGKYSSVCNRGEPVFYYDFPYGLIPGHIYSDLGREEFGITAYCEYHFDEMFKETDEGA